MRIPRPILVALACSAGCGGRPGVIRPPDVDAEQAAEEAIEQHDRDSDGSLSEEELRASPALASIADAYDKSGDGALTADEISTGIHSWQQAGVGARPVAFTVTLDGRPLAGANVRLLPADFLGDAVNPAKGTAGPSGAGQFDMAAEHRPKNAPNIPLMQPGLYKVEITHPSAKIPAKYNAETTLGIEVSSGNPGPQGVTWSLNSK